jgi:hypothetical protein
MNRSFSLDNRFIWGGAGLLIGGFCGFGLWMNKKQETEKVSFQEITVGALVGLCGGLIIETAFLSPGNDEFSSDTFSDMIGIGK